MAITRLGLGGPSAAYAGFQSKEQQADPPTFLTLENVALAGAMFDDVSMAGSEMTDAEIL